MNLNELDVNTARAPVCCYSSAGHNINKMPIKVNVIGGDPAFIAALSVLDLENPEANGEIYNNWASSVKDFPEIINQKVAQSLTYVQYPVIYLDC